MHYLQREIFNLIKIDDSIFEFIQEGSLDGMWYWDLEKPENEWMNAKFWTTLGYDPATKSHHANQWQDIINPEDLNQALDNFNKHCQDPNHPYDQVVRYRHANGSTVWIRCRGMAIRDKNDKPIRMLGAHTEITKEKEQEFELKKLLLKYESILNNQSAFIMRFDINGYINYVNKYFIEFFSLDSDNIIGTSLSSLFNTDEVNNLLSNLKFLQPNIPIKVILPYAANDELIFIEFEISAIRDASNASLEFQGLGINITAKRKAENDIKFQARLLDTIGQAVIATDAMGQITYWNKAATKMYGWKKEEVIGKYINDVTPTQQNKEEAQLLLNELLKGNSWTGEFEVSRKDGSRFFTYIYNTPVMDESGKLQGVIGVSADISQQKELLAKQEQLALVAAKTNDAVVITDADGYTIWVNESFSKITGYSLNDMMNKKPGLVLQGAETDEKTNQRISECLQNRTSCQEVILNYTKDGQKYWLDLTIDPVFDEKGNLKQFIAIEKDVTEQILEKERKQKQNQELKLTKELLEQTSQVAQIGGWDYHIETGTVSWTSMSKKIFEVDEDYIPDLNSVYKFFKEEHERNIVINALDDLIKNGQPYDVTFQIITARGNHRWIRAIGKREFKDGKCIRIYGVNQNIDEQKRATQKFENIRQAINQHTLVSITDLEGKITEVNDIFCETTQYSREELIGKPHSLLNSGFHSKDFFANMWETLQKGKIWRGELHNKRKDGSSFWMLSTIVPFFDLNGKLEQYVNISTDITDQKLSEKEKQKTVEIISEQRNRLLDFSYILSHNVRSHASNILGISDLLKNINSPVEQIELLKLLDTSAHNLDETLWHLNDLLKIQSNFHHKKQTVVIREIVEKIIGIMKHQIEELDADISLDIENNLYTQTDPVYLQNILQNLINNALRFRHPQRSPQIDIVAHRLNGKVQVLVRDNGLGIDLHKYGNKIFGMYRTFHENIGAKGVGLFITKNQVEALGGSIAVESEVNKGSTFRIKL